MTTSRIVSCPRCARMVSVCDHRYSLHSVVAGTDDRCPLSRQRTPVTGMSDSDHVLRAKMVADLAAQLQDSDPMVVWQNLTAIPADELQRLLVVALAAIPIDQTLTEMFAWVDNLPVARTGVAC